MLHAPVLRPAWLALAALGLAGAHLPAARAADAPVPAAFQPYAQQAAQLRYLEIDSQALGERRTVAVSLPASYERQPARRYPVLVLLDGPEQLAHTESLVRFLARGEKIPEMVIVAIANTQRSRDLTPPLPAGVQNPRPMGTDTPVGGADAFLAFLADELLPTLDRGYRTAPWRGLLGHSFGGLFGLHALVQKPELFRAYLLASPSLWWGDGDTRQRAVAAWPRLQSLPQERWVYIGTGANEKSIEESADALQAQLQRLPAPRPNGLHWARERLPLDDHGTTPHLTWLNGLRMAFADWPYAMPERATPADHAAFQAHRQQRRQRYGVDAEPSLFELTHFALAYARASQPQQALALACQLASAGAMTGVLLARSAALAAPCLAPAGQAPRRRRPLARPPRAPFIGWPWPARPLPTPRPRPSTGCASG